MRIAFMTPEFVTESHFDGGLANYLARTSVALHERGHEIEVFVYGDAHETIDFQGVTVHRVPVELTRWDRARTRIRSRFGQPAPRKVEWQARSIARALQARHGEAPFDVVQASNYGLVGLYVRRPRSFPLITRCSYYHPYWWRANDRPVTDENRDHLRLEMRAIRNSDRIYAPSSWLQGVFAREEGIEIDVLETTFFLEETGSAGATVPQELDGRRYLLYFGTIARYKGVHLLAEALAGLLAEHPDLHVAFAGKVQEYRGAPMLDFVRDQAGVHADRVHYLGVLGHANLYPVIANAAVVVFPSLAENLSNACMEALALGRVVVASADVSFEQLVEDGRSGFLFDYGDAVALERVLSEALCMPEADAAQMGAAARESVARLAPGRTLPLLEAYYREAAEAHPRGHRKRTGEVVEASR